ncbi:MAG: winged helix-turn-helix transcriptional regulator [Chloroflexi bacterium]|nr:winged helix-turn-helix transcriptional regulator [Chloroflexota bacterium]
MVRWTLITNHGAVLLAIARHARIKALDIAEETGLTERTIRRIIADLIAEGYVTTKREGGINRYALNPDQTLRRPEMQDKKVRDFIELCSTTTEQKGD